MEGQSPDAGGRVPEPYVQSMLLCDSLAIDLASSKVTLYGCFRSVFSTNFPAAHANAVLYVVLRNGRGNVPLKIQFIDGDEQDEPITLAEGQVEFIDPLTPVEIRQPIPVMVFPKPGEYCLQLFAGGIFLMEYRLTAIQIGGHSS